MEDAHSSLSTHDLHLGGRSVKTAARNALHQLKSSTDLNDADSELLLQHLMPKIADNLQDFKQLQEEFSEIKQTLHSHIQHANVLDQDIAEIFLDIHNIFKKLEKLDGKKLAKNQSNKLAERFQEAELLQHQSKHYINNEP